MSVVRTFGAILRVVLQGRWRAVLSIAALVASMVAVVGVQQAAASVNPASVVGATEVTSTYPDGSIVTVRTPAARHSSVAVAAPGSVTGTVADFNGVPIAGATVTAINASNAVVATTTTAANGTYTLAALTAATYSIGFSHAPAHASLVVPGVAVRDNAATQVNLVLAAATTGAISGAVTGGGAALAGVVVTVAATTGGTAGTATTAADGSYTVGNVAPGSYTVCFNAAAATGGSSTTGYVSACSTGVAVAAAAGTTANKELAAAPAGPTCAPGGFGDVSSTWCNDITWLVNSGITQGTSPTTFGGGSDVTRGQMAMFLYRLGTGTQTAPACQAVPFDDVPVTAQACGSIAWGVANGVLKGIDATHYAPGSPMTREVMALALYGLTHAGATAPACTTAPFDDVLATDAACGAIAWAAASGVTQGTDPAHFSPANSVTRNQMAGFLHRTHDLTQINGTASASGSGVAGVSVIVTGTGSTTGTYSAVTGSAGKYVIPGINAGTYTVCFEGSAATGGPFAFQCYNNVVGGAAPTPVTVAKWTPFTANAALTTAP